MEGRRLAALLLAVTLGASPLSGCGAPRASERWRPTPGSSWHLQLHGVPRSPLGVDVYDLDGADTPAGAVAALEEQGAHTICYFSAGSLEDWRDDVDAIPKSVVGRPLEGWPGEFWLDIRRREVLLPLMAARMDACAAKGFDAVDPDNVDGFLHHTGFALTREDAAAYVRDLAALAHERGLALGLKNAMELLPSVEPDVDFAVNEECGETGECATYAGLVASGKPVFRVEYTAECPDAVSGHSVIVAPHELDGPTQRCA